MDVHQLNEDLKQLLDKKIELTQLEYNDTKYDEVEEEVHQLEDHIHQQYGKYLEEALYGVHDEYCPDTEVLMPIAYVPDRVMKEGEAYKVGFDQGVYVEADDYEADETKLVLLPEPLRIELQIEPGRSEVVWTGR